MRSRAFTLIELLVTIAIIAVLLAISLPFLKGARASAKRAACLANLRSQGHALSMYRDQHDGLMPWAVRPVKIRNGWMEPLPALAEHMDTPLPTLGADDLVVTPAAWKCPMDVEYAQTTGWSYAYLPWDIMSYYEFRSSAPAREATRFFEGRPHEGIIVDARAFHSPRGPDAEHPRLEARNVLLLDGSVEKR